MGLRKRLLFPAVCSNRLGDFSAGDKLLIAVYRQDNRADNNAMFLKAAVRRFQKGVREIATPSGQRAPDGGGSGGGGVGFSFLCAIPNP